MTKLKTNLCGMELDNPLVLASGFWGTSKTLLLKAVENGIGAVTTKSVNTQERKGHNNPVHFDWGGGLINAVGLPGKGSAKTADMILDFKNDDAHVPVIASVFGKDAEEFKQVAKDMVNANSDIIELNMSCPNVASEFGIPFACDIDAASNIISEVKSVCGSIPVFAKLAPNVPSIALVAKECVNAGADGITAINTVPGIVIDIYSGKPVLTNGAGGLSGKAIKPVAIKAVHDIRKALPDTPIIGTGGVLCGEDAVEMLMAGASAIGLGSAIYYRGVEAFKIINEEIANFMEQEGYKSLSEIIGLVHK